MSCTHLYGTGRLGGFVSACSRNMLGRSELENVQPDTTGRGTVSIFTTVLSAARTAWAASAHAFNCTFSTRSIDDSGGSGGNGFGTHTVPTALKYACRSFRSREAGNGGTAAGSGKSRSSMDTSSSSSGVPSGYLPIKYDSTLTKSFMLKSNLSKILN